MNNRFSHFKEDLKILKLYKEHPIVTLITSLYGLLNFGLSVWAIFISSQGLLLISVLIVSMVVLFFFVIIGVSLWNRYRYRVSF